MFPFPSTGKAFPNGSAIAKKLGLSRFPFPSTGTAFPNAGLSGLWYMNGGLKFPFPSTGTAFPNYTEEQKTAIAELGFHSLPPGRHFQTSMAR